MAINYQGGDDVVITSAFQPMMRTMQMNYENQLKQQQEDAKQRDAIRKQASEDLAKVNAGGLWKADLPKFNEYYNAVKESYYKMNTTRDPNEQRKLSMEFSTNLNELNNLVEQSRKVGENFVKAERDILSNSNKINMEQARTSLNSFLEKPSYDIDAGAFTNAISGALKKYDFDKEMSAYRQLGTSFAKNDDNFTPIEKDTPEQVGGNRFVTRVTSYTPNQNAIRQEVSNFFNSKPERQYMLQDYMEANGIVDINEAIESFAAQNNIFTKPSRIKEINANQRSSSGLASSINNLAKAYLQQASEEISTGYMSWGDIKSESVTPRDGSAKLTGDVPMFDIETGQRIPLGRRTFDIEFTQDAALGVTEDGRIVSDDHPEAVEVRNFAVGVVADPTLDEFGATSFLGSSNKRVVALEEQNRQLFGRSSTVKTDATRRSQQSTNRNTPVRPATEVKGLPEGGF